MGSVTSGHWSAIVFMSGLMKACLASNIRVKITVKGAQRKDESWGKLRRTRRFGNRSSSHELVLGNWASQVTCGHKTQGATKKDEW
ncbi:hypothetical protein PCANC_07945 [Puccinia coronata f. sp. avenae]|uniref:Uncharacterized protein n=1 Tax=Puccinia coronata f. sp. avenae TaxID=200324 RepID=A0A2N5UYG0_9BASI|nr:hypothetical protein PCANC_07945 [Puccinia coronata f. sp. avenae]